MLARREYGLLAPMGTVVHPADAGDLGSEDGHEATLGTAEQARRETEEGDETRQSALPACGMQEANDEGRRPPELLHALNACGCQGGERGGGPSTQQRDPMARS